MRVESNLVKNSIRTKPVTEKISLWEKGAYGVGALGKDLYQGLIIAYLMVFLTDIAGVAAASVGLIFLLARIWDAINDPIMGIIVDRTNTRWGRFRPYLLFTPIVLGVASIALFTIPGLGETGTFIYYLIVYIIWGMAFTAFDVPIMSLAPAISKNPHERTSLLSMTRIFTTLAIGLVATFALPIIATLGNGNDARGYQLFIIILAVASVLFAWITFANVEERHTATSKKNSFNDYLHILKSNGPLAFLLLIVFVMMTVQMLNSTMTVYFMSYVITQPELIPIIQALSSFAPLLFVPFLPVISRRFGKIQTTIGLTVLSIIALGIRYLFWSNLPMLFITSLLAAIGFVGIMILATSMLADTVDYAEWKTGHRSEGLIFSFNSFTIKIAMALAGGASGVFLTLVNYVPNVEQTEATMNGINVIFSLVPAVGMAISLFFIFKYNITEEKHAQIIADLDARNA